MSHEFFTPGVYHYTDSGVSKRSSHGPRDARLAELKHYRDDVAQLYAGKPSERMSGFLGPVSDFGLRREDFLAIIDGMEMDVLSDIRAPDLATLDLYCDRVASAVGRIVGADLRRAERRRDRAVASSRTRTATHQYPARHR